VGSREKRVNFERGGGRSLPIWWKGGKFPKRRARALPGNSKLSAREPGEKFRIDRGSPSLLSKCGANEGRPLGSSIGEQNSRFNRRFSLQQGWQEKGDTMLIFPSR